MFEIELKLKKKEKIIEKFRLKNTQLSLVIENSNKVNILIKNY